jgi:hypothetical protein
MPPDSPRRWQSSPPTWSSKPDPILGRTASSRNHASRSPRATACRQSGKRRLRSRFAAERHSYRTGDPHRRRARAQSTQRAGGTKRLCVEGGASLRSRRTIRLTRHKASGSVLGTSVDAGLSEGPPSRTPPDTFRQRSWSPRWGGNSVIASVALVTKLHAMVHESAFSRAPRQRANGSTPVTGRTERSRPSSPMNP